ncbi:hypothetical protein E2C01_066617 [Portunus trituberculatus]|uniref:Uncharacterized protein n=1 Tax=Portunus trituberculatus TaxID=210409 RepID=A0A5B7HQZ6_PORTR|nr:hypothetical protein [Portunus trituberculatus]
MPSAGRASGDCFHISRFFSTKAFTYLCIHDNCVVQKKKALIKGKIGTNFYDITSLKANPTVVIAGDTRHIFIKEPRVTVSEHEEDWVGNSRVLYVYRGCRQGKTSCT